MSQKLDTYNLLDPRLNALKMQQDKLRWGIPQGGAYSNRVAQKANSYSSSGVAWNFNTQGQNVLIDRRFYAKVQYQVTVVGIPKVGSYLYSPGASAPRDFPLAHVAENVSLTINGSSVSMNYADAMQAFLRFNTNMDLTQYDLSNCPTMSDKFALYADAMDSGRNSLNTYQSSGPEQGRGAFWLDSITGNTVGDGLATKTVVIKFTAVEPLFLSPLLYSSLDLDAGLLGVNTIAVNINFSGNLERVWSHYLTDLIASGTPTTSVVLASGTTTVPELLVEYINVPLIDDFQIPQSVIYPYTRVETYSNNPSVTIANGASASVVNNAIQLSVVPKKIYLFATTPRGNKTSQDTDTFFSINSLSLQYLNVAGQFSSQTTNDLYNMSVKNGVKLSYTEWNGRTGNGGPAYASVGLVGSLICIDSTDLALPSNIASGCLVNSQLQFTLGLTNHSGVSQAVNIYCVVCNEGIFEVAQGSANSQVGIVNSEDIISTRATGESKDMNMVGRMNGSSLWDTIKNVINTVPEAIKVGTDVYSVGKKLLGKGLTGEGLTGGQKMTKAQLKAMLE